jgi:hydrogenase expression/formation protein HypC
MQIESIEIDGMARVSAMGAIRDVALDLTPEAQVGDYVLVHAGFAIEVVDEQYAADTLELIKAMSELVDDPLFSEGAVAR